MQYDFVGALQKLDLSKAELAAIALEDEDALRRLAGVESLGGGGLGFWGTQLVCSWFCTIDITNGPWDTKGSGRDTCPGSKGGCGTHNTHNCGGETVGAGFCC